MSEPLYIRRCNLFVADNAGSGLDVGQLEVKFSIKKNDAETPNMADIMVYNLSDATAKQIREEYTRVVLQAGYESTYGIIFEGTIKQVRQGRENGVDKFVNIVAADGDAGYKYATVSKTLESPTQADVAAEATKALGEHKIITGFTDDLGNAKLPRGKTMHGMARHYMRGVAKNTLTTWSIQDGKVVVLSRTAVLPDEVVILNSRTGLIDQPEQTEKGVVMKCLLNPNLKVGGRVKINEGSVLEEKFEPSTKGESKKPPAAIAADGVYRIIMVEYDGDTRGNDWYATLTCLACDATAPLKESVNAA